ncbi:MAG TPA: YeeE/YedE thiosulfate transporter family protein [Pseudolabrys sp.]|nr:YeeE/YedE thiosulfate transporter family protein [Pseudolabrys sp.]
MGSTVRSFWHPLTAGIALGLVLLLTFVLTGHGLGASGFFTRLTAWFGGEFARTATEANSYLGPFVKNARGAVNPLANWISWEIVGVLVGASLAAVTSGRFRFRLDGATNLPGGGRMVLAVGGGILTGFGARLARGCTSGIGLSGGAPLAVAGFVFLIGFFVAGIAVSFLIRRAWA